MCFVWTAEMLPHSHQFTSQCLSKFAYLLGEYSKQSQKGCWILYLEPRIFPNVARCCFSDFVLQEKPWNVRRKPGIVVRYCLQRRDLIPIVSHQGLNLWSDWMLSCSILLPARYHKIRCGRIAKSSTQGMRYGGLAGIF